MDFSVWLLGDIIIFQVWGYVPPLIWAWGFQWCIQNSKIMLFKEGWLMDLLVWLFGDIIIFQVWDYIGLGFGLGLQGCAQGFCLLGFSFYGTYPPIFGGCDSNGIVKNLYNFFHYEI
jgi:hypothetical protein